MSRTRRVLWFVALVGAIVFVVVRRRMAVPEPATAPSWPPFDPEVPVPTPSLGAEPVTEARVDPDEAGGESNVQPWVRSADGECPATHPIKANTASRIYRVPGSRFYDRTRPERCYADAAAAEADGYRAAKGPAASREP